jgi:membrane-associated protease RseP (regulator of RpoE activity)
MPAEASGVRAGDRVISAGGAPVESFEDLRAQLEKAGRSPLSITVLREARAVELEISPDAQGHIGVMPNGERLPMKPSSLVRAIWFPVQLIVLQVEMVGRRAVGSGPTAVLIRPWQMAPASSPGEAFGRWMMLAAALASLAWLPVLLLIGGFALMAERRLAVAPSLGEGA